MNGEIKTVDGVEVLEVSVTPPVEIRQYNKKQVKDFIEALKGEKETLQARLAAVNTELEAFKAELLKFKI